MAQLPPVPRGSEVLNGMKQLITKTWDDWFQQIAKLLGLSPSIVGSVTLAAQSASVGGTAFTTPPLSAGLYRVTYYQRISQAATNNSSLTTSFNWTDGGVACMVSGAAMTGNTTSTTQTSTFTMQIDKSTEIEYTLNRTSVGVTPMTFDWAARLEQLP